MSGTCTSCGSIPTIEGYENFPWLKQEKKEQFEEQKSNGGCSVKDSMTNCLYTTQGMFVCQKDTAVKEGVPNQEMAAWAFNTQQGVAKTAGSL